MFGFGYMDEFFLIILHVKIQLSNPNSGVVSEETLYSNSKMNIVTKF